MNDKYIRTDRNLLIRMPVRLFMNRNSHAEMCGDSTAAQRMEL